MCLIRTRSMLFQRMIKPENHPGKEQMFAKGMDIRRKMWYSERQNRSSDEKSRNRWI